ncbi:hypothetical protein C3486_22525 [Streptomyces sp. Ru73]|uniref:hypothetical protein n=1 Tax=Streptomyces sp. Ru73 TaxID=2080748 RepID=UPI000CDD1213|nr:hypothetical protein [Streptomyces sp. Ru73]POX38595.1 hypothetical protein C3486_22525 [Streptomyces sp. Ru73]
MSRKNNRSALDRALAQAEVLADEYDDYDAQAALNRIARRVVWRKATTMEHRARRARHSSGRPDEREAPSPADSAALHTRAAAHLGSLSCRVVRDPAAIAAMALLVDDPARIEPAGALAFACLLYLADRHEAAQFWWQFAAGADSATAARCLYLHHLQYAEPESALHWHHQAVALYDKEADPMLTERPSLLAPAPDLMFATGQLDVVVEVKRCTRQRRAYEARWWVFTTSLTDAVLRLEIDSDDDFGAIPKPDPDLAAELEEATTS